MPISNNKTPIINSIRPIFRKFSVFLIIFAVTDFVAAGNNATKSPSVIVNTARVNNTTLHTITKISKNDLKRFGWYL